MVSSVTFFARFFLGHAFFVGIFSGGASIAPQCTGHTDRGRISAAGTICTRFHRGLKVLIGILSLWTTNTCGVVVVRIITGFATSAFFLSIRADFSRQTKLTHFDQIQKFSGIAFSTKRRTSSGRFFGRTIGAIGLPTLI